MIAPELYIVDGRLRWSEDADAFVFPPWFGGVLNVRPGLAVAAGEGWLWRIRYEPEDIGGTITLGKLMEFR